MEERNSSKSEELQMVKNKQKTKKERKVIHIYTVNKQQVNF